MRGKATHECEIGLLELARAAGTRQAQSDYGLFTALEAHMQHLVKPLRARPVRVELRMLELGLRNQHSIRQDQADGRGEGARRQGMNAGVMLEIICMSAGGAPNRDAPATAALLLHADDGAVRPNNFAADSSATSQGRVPSAASWICSSNGSRTMRQDGMQRPFCNRSTL